MKIKLAYILVLLLILPAAGFSQGRKTIKKKQISSQTVYEYFLEEGKKEPVIEQIQVYDTTGNVIELKEFNSEGLIKNWQKYSFDADDNKTEELHLDDRGKQLERTEWIYKNDLLVEKKYYDQKNRLVKRKEYKYKYR